MEVKILQFKIDDQHQDSLWYSGAIARTEHFTLVATGEIRIGRTTPNGMYLGTYDGKSRDDFGEIIDDNDIQRIFNSPEYDVDMNNWFEVIPNDNDCEMQTDTVTGTYTDALDTLIDCERFLNDEKGDE